MDRVFISAGLALAAALIPAAAAQAHGGGLDRHGCHHDRKHGGYHCHRSPGIAAASLASSPDPARRNNLTGYVTPAAAGAYRNCTEARAAGAAPVRRGDPGYGPHLDRDNDGKGCE
ncbi:excalibur calcium-binding domain-containing protein [Luteimonas sp. SX5]|uniref:Excalibur calcium-binding domain-containing protein n=1 Tax=Luteimonas galliterrae TaxID=2940486 RepID=A0ABT0MM81_9GAMM|nr:excalibur calcium-binding domain-containing protein [Luteimonas galliterrae]MCL1635713.1 excalibur calcium-binding domain-containing protein [Luteimonas galliterrae]